MNLLEKLLGANWRTTLTGFLETTAWLLTFLAAAPYTLGEVANILPPQWKATIFKVSGIAAGLLALLNRSLAKDRSVTGNGTPDAPYQVLDPASPVSNNRVLPTKLLFIALLALLPFVLTSCETIPVTARLTYGGAAVSYDGKRVAIEADAASLMGFSK